MLNLNAIQTTVQKIFFGLSFRKKIMYKYATNKYLGKFFQAYMFLK